MTLDPVATNPQHYRVLLENEQVRVLQYEDAPGDATTPHQHPDSVMITGSAFRRLLVAAAGEREVEMAAGVVTWLPAQEHSGANIGDTPTRVIFVELKGTGATVGVDVLGPA
ncbi:MAG TPA: cytoplasmic protein [Actinotalea sp.]|jgi:quercetin dioxygenase-like cupin family protein